jgi:hypothetical protein
MCDFQIIHLQVLFVNYAHLFPQQIEAGSQLTRHIFVQQHAQTRRFVLLRFEFMQTNVVQR